MKRIIEGVAYDTDTAIEIATGSHDHEMSQAWWTLYRTTHGAYFEVVAGHDGVVEGFVPLTDKQARKFLEVNANNLVEVHFGPMPEARPLQFSRGTLIAAVKMMERMTHADFSEFLLELGPEFSRVVANETVSMRKRLNSLISLVDEHPRRRLDSNELLRDRLVGKAASLVPPSVDWVGMPRDLPPYADAFTQALALDGFTLADGAIRRTLPIDVGLPMAESEIDRLLQKHALATAKGHLSQALDAHARGNWAAANSQVRTFLDALLDEIAVKLDPNAATLGSGHPRRERLAGLGFLSRDLNEWQDNGQGFINGLAKRLHPAGSHPGLSDGDDSAFRLHIVLITAQLLLTRFDAMHTP